MNSKKRNIVVIIAFICIMTFFTIMNIPNLFSSLKGAAGDDIYGIAACGPGFAENFSFKFGFVNGEGVLNSLLYTNEFNTIKRVENVGEGGRDSFVSSVDLSYTVNEKAQKIIDYKEKLASEGTDLVFVGLPHEIAPYDSARLNDYSNPMLDSYLSILQSNGVDTIDMREFVSEEYDNYYDAFYYTDHHWTTEASLKAYEYLFAKLNDTYKLDINPKFLDASAYDKAASDSRFLGSNGRKTGDLYSGFDTYNCYIPQYDTNFKINKNGEVKTGNFGEVFLYPEYLEGDDYFTKEQFYTYLGKDAGLISIENLNADNDKSVLIYRDSYSRHVICAMASCFKNVDAVDLRHFTGTSEDLRNPGDYDLVIVAYCPYMLINDSMFDFR